MLSIICVYNDYEILNKCLLSSIKIQNNCKYEIITIDSRKYSFSSAAEALNYGAKNASGDYYVFLHQDIKFLTDDTLEKLEQICLKYDFGIAGVAGIKRMPSGELNSISKILHGKKRKAAAKTRNFDSAIEVDSLDECLIIIPKHVFSKRKFYKFYNTWHLYATEYCIAMKECSKRIITIPLQVVHESEGDSLNNNYFDAVYLLAKKYNKTTKEIITFFGKWPTNLPVLKLKCIWRKVRFKMLEK